jgi:putative FmdB family regulatory protein
MPIYEYRCRKGHTFEVMQSVIDDPVKKCEVCGAPVERVLHAPAVHFKGSGFYNTDYGTRKRQREQKASNADSSSGSSSSSDSGSSSDSSSSSSSDSGSKTSTDSKPAEKSSSSGSDSSKPAKAKP